MMFEFPFNTVIPIGIVVTSIILLAYFGWKTLIISNLYQKGVDLFKQKDYADAETAFRKVIAINSTNDAVRLLLADTLMQQAKIEPAITMYKEVITRAPKKVEAYLRLSNALMQQDQKKEAISYLQTAQSLLETQRQSEQAQQVQKLLERIDS